MKKICNISLILICIILILTGCGNKSVEVNVAGSENNKITLSSNNLVSIVSRKLYCDTKTNIVYWWNGVLTNTDASTTPTPYYAPNGLPYKYNPNTNTLVEIAVE